ncbi:MAG: hypothetical protein IIA87_00355 [Nanoarchaeota archaeon]|nr:hypothetical protein [Nanoarchaeota archaeon]
MLKTYQPKNPRNRIDLNDGNYCPPHRFGEGTLIFKIRGEPVTNEPCHIHKARLSHWSHHDPFCIIKHCPHYEEMKQAERGYRTTGEI